MDSVEVKESPLSVEEATRSVTSPHAGAISVFVGTTRDHHEGKGVVRLEYEAYVTMAEKELRAICRQVRDKWQVDNICIRHRLGLVPVTEASVIIAISSAHRKAALEAVTYTIDTLKATVPIWKKEVYDDGSATWKENPECAWRAT